MADGKTYGINFPFRDSFNGKYLDLSDTSNEEIRSDLIHLLLTRKGSRYFLPEFGTRLYELIFEPMDGPTFASIEDEIRKSVEQFIPNLRINKITITAASDEEETLLVSNIGNVFNQELYIPNQATSEYTARVRVDFTVTSDVFNPSVFVIIII
jgi:phage baseplate assembly protein W